MIPSPHELTYFIELAHTLNFSRASERLGISQPSLSNAIKRLEQTIGVEVFIRCEFAPIWSQWSCSVMEPHKLQPNRASKIAA